MSGGWRVAIDRGGTFADVVATAPDGARHVRKVLAAQPGAGTDPVVRALRELIPHGARLDELQLGTTIATNALLERRGARVGLAITQGLGDLLAIGSQQRPELFALDIRKPAPLVLPEDVVEVDQRSYAPGTLSPQSSQPPQGLRGDADLRAAFRRMREGGVESLAVVLAHHYGGEGEAESVVAALAREAGFEHVSCGHRVAGEVGLWARAATTVLDAYLTPPLQQYLLSLQRELGTETALSVFRSSGGLSPADGVSGKDTVLSGPAGGAAACERLAASTGLQPMIGFDMGGTSTDVCRVGEDGAVGRVFETAVDGVPLRTPMVEVITVAAGGGSIVEFDGRKLTVGPHSAGAVPGPACYGRGGPATLTDANVVLGRIQPDWFPVVFGEQGDEPLDAEASRARFDALAEAMGSTAEHVAAGAFRIAVSEMAEAIKQVTTARGIDPRTHALCAFGGAAGQHACAVAEALGIEKVVLHPLGSVLSAWGIAGAAREETGVLALGEELTARSFTQALEGVGAMAARLGDGLASPKAAFSFDLRTPGTDSSLNIEVAPDAGVAAIETEFARAHRALFGFEPAAGTTIELVNARVRVTDSRTTPPELQRELWPAGIHGPPHPVAEVELSGERSPVWRRSALKPGMRLPGPALVVDELTTVVIDAGWGGSVSSEGTIHLARVQGVEHGQEAADVTACDPVLLEIFQNRFMSIAEQMGHTLQRTAHSTNIKERLDFSCALFDGAGNLVANAPHIPVHLGAMGESVRAIVDARGDAMQPGDAYVTNDPFHGGSHLPDVTVVSPVCIGGRREFFVACRGHHADVGGFVPGSMPPDATSIDEEGVRIHDLLAVRAGELLEDAVAEAFGAGPHPARDIPERISDLRAQLAANAVGVRLLQELCEEAGTEVVAAYMAHAQDDAAAAMEEALQALEEGERRFTDRLDDGTPVAVSISISSGTATVDFAGTGGAHPGNLNAPRAVVMAAVLYSFRTLISVDRPMPLNAGIFRPITVRVPEGSLLDPPNTAAVSGGNVETAQRLVDVLLGALGTCAASQGTMNNLTFGDDAHAHYETLAGGAGAGPGFDGASAVHVHMTNTRITDPEVLERRHPVILREFSIRRGSGGKGEHTGGDGVRRVIEALAPLTVSIVSERRTTQPYGMAGGEPGQSGRNAVERSDGSVEDLPGRVTFDAQPGDRIIIETPGGGGWGSAQ